jgi:hypothetical protein
MSHARPERKLPLKHMTVTLSRIVSTVVGLVILTLHPHASAQTATGPRFSISFPASVHPEPITGRLFLMISRTGEPEVRLQSTWVNSPEIAAVNVTKWLPGHAVVIDGPTLGSPLRRLDDLPTGDYNVQAVVNLYTDFHRADGHVIWAHMDHWEGQQFNRSPGNLYSPVVKLHVDRSGTFDLSLSQVIPPVQTPADTQWVKYIKIQSKLLTRFWGRPIYLGAVVLLPNGYSSQPDTRYPVIYYQPEHFRSFPPFEFTTEALPESDLSRRVRESSGYETGFEFGQAWRSEHFPRMIAVSIITPTPLSDWSGGVDSVNNGPYGQAIMTEMIPYIEARFRIIREPYARVLTGKHSAGRTALALQLQHPEFFGGTWSFHPWAFNFQSYFGLNIYDNDNAFYVKSSELPEWARNPSEWLPAPERYFARTTAGAPMVSFKQASLHDAVMVGVASGDPIGADDAIIGPVGADGYPKVLWDRATGKIDPEVVAYWREHGDLAYYTQKNWQTIGPQIAGKLHVYVGDMDQFYRNYGVHLFEDFLRAAEKPHYQETFAYGALDGSRQPMTNAELVRMMASHIAKNTPQNGNTSWQEGTAP